VRGQTLSAGQVNLAWVSLAAVLYALFCLANAGGWWLILVAWAQQVPARDAICLWIRCESLRWLPGSIWNFGARAVDVARREVPHAICGASMILELLFAVGSRVVLVFAAGLGSDPQGLSWLTQLFSSHGAVLAGGVGLLAAITAVMAIASGRRTSQLWPQLAAACAAVPRAPRLRITWAVIAGYYLATSVVQGLSFLCVVRGIHPDCAARSLALIVINSVAWLAGFFAVFAPGGLVVREACLAAALTKWCSPAESITIAVAWRVLQIVVEAIALVIVVWIQPAGQRDGQGRFSRHQVLNELR
jgi:hypothetical protein